MVLSAVGLGGSGALITEVIGLICSANGTEFVAKAVREWITAVGARTAFIEPGSPWQNGYCESFNSKLRDELLNGDCQEFRVRAGIMGPKERPHGPPQRTQHP
jgi:putative transposase